MQFIHFIILPSLILSFSILLQNWLNKEEFIQYYKLYFMGIVIGLLILFIFKFINPFFYGAAKYLTILLKTLFVNGIFFTLFTVIILFSFFYIGQNIKHSGSWSLTSILSFSYISGIYTMINIQECNNGNYPDYIIHYFSFIPLILFASLILGAGLYRIIYHFEIYLKILWSILIILILIISFTSYYFLTFYNYYYKYIFLLLFSGMYVIFELTDFKSFRS
ncbi:MAG: hypothetical protein JXA99_12285 [Candidatus Lokiarchaeota archaeon]|nr:hypothetical protein [Candidatus Lokiarchaeota archaeon]